jgi:hypothetical protein
MWNRIFPEQVSVGVWNSMTTFAALRCFFLPSGENSFGEKLVNTDPVLKGLVSFEP